LLPGLIHSLRHNVSRKNYDVALFEVGRVFTEGRDAALSRQKSGDSAARCPYQEERRVAIALTGRRHLPFWSGDDRDATLDA
jgi:phenylalanyl-tRNA synthetase beta subunit